jgi:hypothetical protein
MDTTEKPNVEKPNVTAGAPVPPPAAQPDQSAQPVQPAATGDKAVTGFFSRFEAPELQLKVLGILLGALALVTALLVILRVTSGPGAPPAPVVEENETYTGLVPDTPAEEPVPPPARKILLNKKPASTGRTWIERSEGPRTDVPSSSGAPAPPPVKASPAKAYVPGDAREFLSDLKVPTSVASSVTPSAPLPPLPAPGVTSATPTVALPPLPAPKP